MFDWNGNGKHDAFDDFVTFGLVQHMIDESKKNEQPLRRIKAGRFIHTTSTMRTKPILAVKR